MTEIYLPPKKLPKIKLPRLCIVCKTPTFPSYSHCDDCAEKLHKDQQQVKTRQEDIKESAKNTTNNFKLLRWQSIISKQWIEQESNQRNVHWFYDPIGCSGKAELAQWWADTFPDYALHLINITGRGDASIIFKKALKRGWKGKLCILEYSRSMHNNTGIYNVLEMACNGRSSKADIKWKPKWIVVFASFMPNMEKMSKDRWMIYEFNWKEEGCNDDGYSERKQKEIDTHPACARRDLLEAWKEGGREPQIDVYRALGVNMKFTVNIDAIINIQKDN